MASEAQVRANAENAQRSTGPRSDEGKAASAQNALKHGLRAAQVLLPEEDPAPLDALREALRGDVRPSGPVEELLFDRIVAAAWRLQRAHLIERGIFERVRGTYDRSDTASTFTQQLRHKFTDACASADALGKLSRYENSIERSMHRTLTELRKIQSLRGEEADEEKSCRTNPILS